MASSRADLVREDDVREDGTPLDAEASRGLIEDLRADHIGR
jgi:hypothetical protein